MIKPIALPPSSARPLPGRSTPNPQESFLATQAHRVELAETLAHELGHDPTCLQTAQAALTQHRALALLSSQPDHLADLQAILLMLTKVRDQDRHDQALALKTRRVELMEKEFAASPSQTQQTWGPGLTDEVMDEVERRLAAL